MMSSYQMRLTDRQRSIGRIVQKIQRSIAHALANAKAKSGLTQQHLANKLGVDRSVINRRVMGRANLTIRSLAELAWALDMDIKFELVPKQRGIMRAASERKRASSWRQGASQSRAEARLKPNDPLLALLRDKTGGVAGAGTIATNDNWHQLDAPVQNEAA